MQLVVASSTPTPGTQYQLAQRAYDHFESAYELLVPGRPTNAERSAAIEQVGQGVELLGQAYAAIPTGAYDPGNEALCRSWAAQAVHELRTGEPADTAAMTLDELLERVSNDFDLQ